MPELCRGLQVRSTNGIASLLNYVALTVYKIDHSAVDGNPEVRFKCLKKLVGARGFEPPTPWSRTRCSTRLSHAPTRSTGVEPRRLTAPGRWRSIPLKSIALEGHGFGCDVRGRSVPQSGGAALPARRARTPAGQPARRRRYTADGRGEVRWDFSYRMLLRSQSSHS